MAQLDLKRVVTFHHRVADAHDFADTFRATARHLASLDDPGTAFPDPDGLWAAGIDGTMSVDVRHALLGKFDGRPEDGTAPYQRTLIANAGLLGEGVNIPAIDCVVFADVKDSIVDTVQARRPRPAAEARRGQEGHDPGPALRRPAPVPERFAQLAGLQAVVEGSAGSSRARRPARRPPGGPADPHRTDPGRGRARRRDGRRAAAGQEPEPVEAALTDPYPWWNPSWPITWQREYVTALRYQQAGVALEDLPRDFVTDDTEPLGEWIYQQAIAFEKLHPEQVQLLLQIGITAVESVQTPPTPSGRQLRQQRQLDDRLAAVAAFRAQHGHDVPIRQRDTVIIDGREVKVGQFINNLRKRLDRLTPQQLDQVTAAGLAPADA
jgi:hypothetical protein